ncbi:Uncharacterised protein [Acinetobacter baumannii]|nr:Uncharacterised protein [Acinetobacter baumannii]
MASSSAEQACSAEAATSRKAVSSGRSASAWSSHCTSFSGLRGASSLP